MKNTNRINALLKRKTSHLLSVYYTAGFPALTDTIRVGKLLAESGVDMIEIGIPFSDPVADGPVIQASNKVALDSGMTLLVLLEQVKELRSNTEVPIILMGYFNPVYQLGVENFCRKANEAGVDGLIIPDLPLEEFQELYMDIFHKNGLSNIFLVAPTTSDDRIKSIDQLSDSFIYAVSSFGTTGAKQDFTSSQEEYFDRLNKMNLKNPFLIGFGVSNKTTFSTVCQYASGAIVGSAFINMLKESSNLEEDIPRFIKTLRP